MGTKRKSSFLTEHLNMSKKININDPKEWNELNWDEPIVPEALKRTDSQVNRARINRLRNQSPAMREAVVKNNEIRVGALNSSWGKFGDAAPFFGHNHDDSNKAAMSHAGEENGMYGVRLTGELNHMFGETHSDVTKQHLKEMALNRETNHHCEHCNGDFTAQAYKQHHGEHCAHNPNRIVKERNKMKKEICPHCGTEAAPKAFARLHGDNCKKKART